MGLDDLRLRVFSGPISRGNFRFYFVEPLYFAGLIGFNGGLVGITDLGRAVLGYVLSNGVPSVFSLSEKCYEAIVVLKLGQGNPLGFDDLVRFVPGGSLLRVLRRLKGYVVVERGGFFRRLSGRDVGFLRNTVDRSVVEFMRGGGVFSVKAVAGGAGFPVRTVYKSLLRLEQSGLVERVRSVVKYKLGEGGLGLYSYLVGLAKLFEGVLRDDLAVAIGIIRCLLKRGYAVSEREIYEDCVGRLGFGVDKVNAVRSDLKSFGLIVGNVYMGYAPSKVLLGMVKDIYF